MALLAAGVPYTVLLLTHQNLSVTILSLVVVVITVQSLLSEVQWPITSSSRMRAFSILLAGNRFGIT